MPVGIKRDGKLIQSPRTKNAQIAKETLNILAKGVYISPSGKEISIQKQSAWCLKDTVLYAEEIEGSEISPISLETEVVNEKFNTAAMRLLKSGKKHIAALNFAAARNQGGGFLEGATAQEEDLCRSSSLYPCLLRKPMFYNKNILGKNSLYTDSIIYSPAVPFFRDDNNELLEEPFELSIITSPAPNLTEKGMTEYEDQKIDEKMVCETLFRRMSKILKVAHRHGHKNLILGAWGCGAFGNDPEMVASLFKQALEKYPLFEFVSFAVYDRGMPATNLEVFRKMFGKQFT